MDEKQIVYEIWQPKRSQVSLEEHRESMNEMKKFFIYHLAKSVGYLFSHFGYTTFKIVFNPNDNEYHVVIDDEMFSLKFKGKPRRIIHKDPR